MLTQSGSLPDAVIACVGGGSNAIGMFHPFIGDESVEIVGIEAGGKGKGLGQNAATLAYGRPGVLQGAYSLLLQDEHGQIRKPILSPRPRLPRCRPRTFAAEVGRTRALRSRYRRRITRSTTDAPRRRHSAGHRIGARICGRKALRRTRQESAHRARARRQGHADIATHRAAGLAGHLPKNQRRRS
jgi:hypothetical protein